MAGAWISAWSATSLSRVPAYPFRLSTCAAASRIRSLVRADLDPASSSAATSGFLGTSRIIGARLFPALRTSCPPPRACPALLMLQPGTGHSPQTRWPTPATPSRKASFYPEVESIRASLIQHEGRPAAGRLPDAVKPGFHGVR